jgi:hypothetical protein
MNIIPISAALELLLVVIEGALPKRYRRFLPLGGSHLAQVGIVFAGPWALLELAEQIAKAAGINH